MILAVKRDRDWNEWQVIVKIGGKIRQAATYHTDDKEDATATMHQMAARYLKKGHPVRIAGK